jgi:hypothetical protein
VSLAASWFAWQTWGSTPAPSTPPNVVPATGTATFNSVPEGALITIDGTDRGVTPLRLSLAAGAHAVQITSGAVSRTIPITIEPGGVVSQYVELAVAPPTTGGRLEIGSDPPGAQVALDGVTKGVTPLAIADVAPGQHRVTVTAGENSVNRTVNITRGATSSLVVSTAPSAASNSGGWLTVQAPIEMDILEDGRILGNTRMDRVMLPVGSHRIEIANSALEFTVARTVQIAAGRTANVAIALPQGRLSVNAVPWAEVSLDGAALGTTPLGEVAVSVGTHELVFRHPQLGERRVVVNKFAQMPLLEVAYHGPAALNQDYIPMKVLDYILLRGESSRLYRRLVDQDQVATSVGGGHSAHPDPFPLKLSIQPRSGVQPDRIEQVLYLELEQVRTNLVSEVELQKAKNTAVADFYRSKGEGFGDRRYNNDNRITLTDDPDPADHDTDFESLVDERRRAKWQQAADLAGWPLSEFIVITLDRASKEVLAA